MPIDQAVRDQIAELRKAGVNKTEIARRLGLGRQTVIDQCKLIEPQADPDKSADQLVAERIAKMERDRELARRRDALKQIAGESSLRAMIESLIRDTVKSCPPIKPIEHRPTKHDTATESLLLNLSDWHAYEVVSLERTLGLNQYNGEIFEERVRRIASALVSIKHRMERGDGWRFPELVIAANGDFVSGTIHDLERHTDAENIVMAVYRCGMVLGRLVASLAGEFERIRMYCTSGNHGRLPDARRMQQKDPTRNWDTLVYLFAKTYLANVSNVEIVIPNAYGVIYEVRGRRFLQTHGHQIKSYQGFPFYGVNRKVTQLNAIRHHVGQPIHHCLFGHFHTSTSMDAPGGEYFGNGSLIGSNEYVIEELTQSSEPKQWLLGVHDKNGVTHRWPLLGNVPAAAVGA